MLLVGPHSSLDLSVIGYQFPNDTTDPYDSNWLKVSVRVRHPRGDWSRVDPCLLTDEAARLATWLEDVSARREVAAECDFLEPNLHFELLGGPDDVRVVRVHLRLELRPPWAHGGDDAEDVYVDVPAHPDQLVEAAGSLRADLARYPRRGER